MGRNELPRRSRRHGEAWVATATTFHQGEQIQQRARPLLALNFLDRMNRRSRRTQRDDASTSSHRASLKRNPSRSLRASVQTHSTTRGSASGSRIAVRHGDDLPREVPQTNPRRSVPSAAPTVGPVSIFERGSPDRGEWRRTEIIRQFIRVNSGKFAGQTIGFLGRY